MKNVIRAILASALVSSMVFSLVPAAYASTSEYRSVLVTTGYTPMENSQDEILIDGVAEHLLKGFQELDQYISLNSERVYVVDYERLYGNSVDLRDVALIQDLVSILNSQYDTELDQSSPYSTRSWTSFGLCVVGGVTGVQVKEISSYVSWKEFGTAIKSKDWGSALNLLKSGISRYMEKHGAKVGAKVALKQILNSSGVGFAAQAGVAAIGCAAIEGWRWWQS